MWHKHKWEVVGFTITSHGLVAPRGCCFDVLRCSKCKKLKTGDIREFTEEEKLSMANNYKKEIQQEDGQSVQIKEIITEQDDPFTEVAKVWAKSIDEAITNDFAELLHEKYGVKLDKEAFMRAIRLYNEGENNE